MHVRVCRECGEEYRPDVVRCADCGGELEDRFLEEHAPGFDPAPGVIPAIAPLLPPPGEQRAVVSSSQAADLDPLAKKLAEAGIPFLVRGGFQSFTLLVADADVDRAMETLGIEPEASPAAEGAPTACPACGAAVPDGAPECPGCGLGLGAAGEARLCPRCGRPIPADAVDCAACAGAE